MVFMAASGSEAVTRRERWRRRLSRRGWKIALGVVLVLLAARAALPFYLEHVIEQKLAALEDYDGEVEDVDLNLWRGAYEIEGLRIVKTDGRVPVPFLFVPKTDISVQWNALIDGAAVGELVLHEPALNFVEGRTPEESQTKPPGNWFDAVQQLFPLRLNRFAVHGGEIHYRNLKADPEIDIYLGNLEAEAANLTNSEDLADDLPARLQARATAMEQGRLRLDLQLDPFAERPTFDLAARLQGLDLTELNPYLRDAANFDVHRGRLDAYAEVASAEGEFKGYVKPFLTDVDVVRWQEDVEEKGLLQTLYESLVGVGADLLQGERGQAARIPLEGTFEDPDVDVWGAIGSALRNAFIQALVPGLEGSIGLRSG